MANLNLSYLGHTMRRQDSVEMTMMLEKMEGSRKSEHGMDWFNIALACYEEDLLEVTNSQGCHKSEAV